MHYAKKLQKRIIQEDLALYSMMHGMEKFLIDIVFRRIRSSVKTILKIYFRLLWLLQQKVMRQSQNTVLECLNLRRDTKL